MSAPPPPSGDNEQPNPHTGIVDANNEKLKMLQAHAANGVKFSKAPGGGCPFLALQNGMAYMDDDNHLKGGARGPSLLEDQIHREKINHFDHERIPERVVHARGVGVHGFFQVYKSQAAVTKASLFQDPSVKTPLFTRFSTVLGSRGASETAREVRGYATKFYTQEGNWDLVGNNIPIFFIQDSIKFPDLIHSGKPEPQTEMPQAATAHDNFWDFISFTPESLAMTAWAMSDRALPRSLRMMQGFGVHTFALINAEGKRTFVKFHIRPKLGVHGLCWDESMKIGGVDPDFLKRDLYDAISAGNFPEFELGFQLVAEADEDKFDFDLLDSTKIIPEEEVGIEWIGKIVYDRLPADFFAETEQVAFCTSNIVPGLDFSNDPLLAGRNFSYQDTQLSRLGSVNFNQIPINRPIIPVLNNQRDGHMQQNIHTDKLNYFPNRLTAQSKNLAAKPGNGGETQGPLSAAEAKRQAFESYAATLHGVKERVKAPKFKEHVKQAQLFFNSQTAWEQQHILDAYSFELSKVVDLGVRERIRDMVNEMDHAFAVKLAGNIGVAAPGAPKHPNAGKKSAFLSMVAAPYTKFDTIATRKVACILTDGFKAADFAKLKAGLAKEGAMAVVIGAHRGGIAPEGMQPIPAGADEDKLPAGAIKADFTLFNSKSLLFDSVAVVGGAHVAALKKNGSVAAFLSEALKHCKAVLALGEAISLVDYPCKLAGIQTAALAAGSPVVSDQAVITAGDATGDAVETFIDAMKKHRYWERNIEPIPA